MTSEEKKAEKILSGGTEGNNDNGNEPEAGTLIDRANSAAERLKAENDRKEVLLKREEELAARRALGGETKNAPDKAPVETPQEYMKRVMSNRI